MRGSIALSVPTAVALACNYCAVFVPDSTPSRNKNEGSGHAVPDSALAGTETGEEWVLFRTTLLAGTKTREERMLFR
ncbi:hypothetical protein, partial [Geomicrobium sp. JCM 19039]|uniref:hypothetical protein n=1 Tax=Geomicrobium sp. JCM 19039 TaxID=1460636 RepID=UPI001268C4AB